MSESTSTPCSAGRRALFAAVGASACVVFPGAVALGAPEAEMTLEYVCRYDHQPGEPDHLLNAIEVSGDRAIVAGNRGLALVDLAALPVDGTTDFLHRLTGLNARDVYTEDGTFVYVNLHRAGVTVYDDRDPDQRTIVEVGTCAEALAWVPGGDVHALRSAGEDRLVPGLVEIVFVVQDGRAVALELHQGRNVMKAKRVAPTE